MPGRPGIALVVVEIFLEGRGLGEIAETLQFAVQARRDHEALLGQLDGGAEEVGPGQQPVILMRHVKHLHRARHADRAAADADIEEGARLAVGVEEQVRSGGFRCDFAAFVRRDLRADARRVRGLVIQHESAAADARGLWFDEGEHELRRDRRVDRVAALVQDLHGRLCGIGVRGHGHILGRADRLGLARGEARLR